METHTRVDTCTGLLPENKPRYVMGVVRMLLPVLREKGSNSIRFLGLSRRSRGIRGLRRGYVRLCLADSNSRRWPLTFMPNKTN
jgi:hypothetical protein